MRHPSKPQNPFLDRLAPSGLAAVALCTLLACGSDSGLYSGKQGDSCDSVLNCGEGLGCDPVSNTCQPRTDGGPGLDAAVDATPDASPVDSGVGPQLDADIPDVYIPPQDGALAACLFVPPQGVFAPQMECRWDTPAEYTLHDDVVMAPVVANVTDDNHDGITDTDDVPDIIFLSYRYEQDGCCNTPAVLRVVSGRCDPDATHLVEMFHIAGDPWLDNSGGIAVGDIDGDLLPDIVTMRRSGGTVAYSSVLYDRFLPDGNGTDDGQWNATPAGDAYAAVDEDPPDDAATYVEATGAGTRQSFTWAWGRTTAAIASVRITARARAVGTDGVVSLYLRDGGTTSDSATVVISAGGPFAEVAASFAKNPFNTDFQWTDADLNNLEFGVLSTQDSTGQLQVTQIGITVGYVIKKWEVDDPQGADHYSGAQPAIVDLDRDGTAEILVGRVVLDGVTGQAEWRGLAGRGLNAFMGPISIAADLDLDGVMEVIAGNTVYRADGVELWSYQYGAEGTGCGAVGVPCDGYNATGNFDSDPEGEVVTIREGNLYILEHDGTLKVMIPMPQIDCSRNEGGPPTVADFDGDGEAEVGVAGADYYTVFDLECCNVMPACDATPTGNPDCQAPGVRWAVPNEDCSSRVTGSSVFDFDGDGAAEVVYNDECKFRIMRGTDGAVLFEKANHSHTRLEYTVIADTDNDGNAEIVFIENGWCSSARCGVAACSEPTTGIQIWGDANDGWVPTRRIWNQHAYHVTNITEDGLLPPGGEIPNWLVFNNYRQNMPDYNVFAAPDLLLNITGFGYSHCPGHLDILAEVCNDGDLRVGPGSPVSFYDESSSTPIQCTNPVATTGTLNPGHCEAVVCEWVGAPTAPAQGQVRGCVDNSGYFCDAPGNNNECLEDNNLAQFQDVGCSGGPG